MSVNVLIRHTFLHCYDALTIDVTSAQMAKKLELLAHSEEMDMPLMGEQVSFCQIYNIIWELSPVWHNLDWPCQIGNTNHMTVH